MPSFSVGRIAPLAVFMPSAKLGVAAPLGAGKPCARQSAKRWRWLAAEANHVELSFAGEKAG